MIKLYIIDFLTSLCFVSNILNLYFEKNSGYSFSEIGILFGVLQISKFIFEIPTGIISDKYGRRTSLIIGILLQIISYGILLIGGNLYIELLAMVLLGCSYTFSTGTTSSIRVEMCEAENIDLLHANTVSWYIYYFAFAISSVLSGVLIKLSFNYTFYLNIISLVVALLILVSLKSNAVLKKEKNLKVKEVCMYLIKNKKIYYYILVGFMIDFVMMPIDSFYNNYLYNDFHFSYISIGCIVALQFTLQGLVVMFSEKQILKINKNTVIKWFPVITMCIFLIFSIVKKPYISVIIYMLGWMFFSAYISIFDTEKQKCISSKYRSSTLSFEALMIAVGASFTKILYGYLSDFIGMRNTMILFISFAILILLLFEKIYVIHTERR